MLLKKVISYTIAITLILLTFVSCARRSDNKNKLVIFYAGSLGVPLMEIKDAFQKKHPGVNIILESAGSRKCCRKIADLKLPCDVMLSADYSVINKLLIPKYASWCIKFASNEMSIVYSDKSKYANEINSQNWYKILTRKDVICGNSNPDDDPCGYRAILTMKLAQIYYNYPDLLEKIQNKKSGMIMRPQETDLLSLLDSNSVDYIFLYKSIAEQHHLKYIKLPVQINLSDPGYADFYKQAEIKISGAKPGTYILKIGSSMLYGVTILQDAPNPKLALKFVEFLLNKNEGLKFLERNGQKSVIPSSSKTYVEIPSVLQKYAL